MRDVLPQLILICILTGINAFFAATEMALVSVDKFQLEELAVKGNEKAVKLLDIINSPNRFLATIQVSITLAGFFSSASAATGLSGGLASVFAAWGMRYHTQAAIIIVTIILSYFILVFGELFPKRLALGNPLKVSLFSIGPLHMMSILMTPFVKVLSITINALLMLLRIKQTETEDKVTEEKVRLLIRRGAMEGNIKHVEMERIRKIFEFDNKWVKDVMVAADDVFMIDIDEEIDDILEMMVDKKHTRVPVFQETRNNVMGILHMKEVFELTRTCDVTRDNLIGLLHETFETREYVVIDQLFLKMQREHQHMAVVKNIKNEFKGIITLEDMVEEIFGEIKDEFEE